MNTALQSLFASAHFNSEVLRALAENRDQVLQEPVIGLYCFLSKSLVSDQTANVERFVNGIRAYDPRWNGMCDSLEFLEFMIDHLERLADSSICRIIQRSIYTLQCGHEGVIADKESREHYLYYQQLGNKNSTSSMEYRCPRCPGSGQTIATCETVIHQLPLMLIVALDQDPRDIATSLQLEDSSGVHSFELRSIYCYVGSGDSGHYFAVVYSKGLWFLCDDAQIQRVNGISKRVRHAARSLLYERLD